MTLSPTVSRLLAVALLLILLATAFLYLLVPLYNAYNSRLHEVSMLKTRLARYEQLLAAEPSIQEESTALEASASDNNLFLQGTKLTIASANLRELLDDMVRDAGGELTSSQGYDPDALPSATPVGLELQINGEVRNLVELLHAIEDARPLIFIDSFSLSSSANRTGISRQERQARTSRGVTASLVVRMNIVGYLPGEAT